jgi:hypothetical protein
MSVSEKFIDLCNKGLLGPQEENFDQAVDRFVRWASAACDFRRQMLKGDFQSSALLGASGQPFSTKEDEVAQYLESLNFLGTGKEQSESFQPYTEDIEFHYGHACSEERLDMVEQTLGAKLPSRFRSIVESVSWFRINVLSRKTDVNITALAGLKEAMVELELGPEFCERYLLFAGTADEGWAFDLQSDPKDPRVVCFFADQTLEELHTVANNFDAWALLVINRTIEYFKEEVERLVPKKPRLIL